MMPLWIQYSQALATPAIALLAIVIAVLQWRTNSISDKAAITNDMTTLIGRPSKQYLCAARKVDRKSPPSMASRQLAFQLPVQGRARYHFCARSFILNPSIP